jgi:long-chain fatty acid transport protein
MMVPLVPRKQGRCAAAVFAVLLAPVGASDADASGLSLPLTGRVGSSVVGRGASSTWHNPGWLPFLGATTVEASGGLVLGRASYERERRGVYQFEDSFAFQLPVSPFDIDPSKRGFDDAVTATPFAPLGSFFVAGAAGRMGWGFGVFAPWGAVLDLPDDGPQRWALQEASILAVHLTPAVAVRVTDRLGVGVGASLVVGHAGLRRVQDFAELQELGEALARPPISQANAFGPDAPVAVRELEVLSRPISFTDGVAVRGTFHAGISAELTERVRAGLVWQHGVDMQWSGDVALDMDDDFFVRDLVSEGLAWEPRVRGRGTLGVRLPSALRGGLAVAVGDGWAVEPHLSWVRWSSVEAFDVRVEADGLAMPALGLPPTQQLRIERQWNDTVEAMVLGRRTFEAGEVVFGGGYHSPASPDRWMDIAAVDGHRVVLQAGGFRQHGPSWRYGGSFELQAVMPRRVVGSLHDRGNGRYGLVLAGLTFDVAWRSSGR